MESGRKDSASDQSAKTSLPTRSPSSGSQVMTVPRQAVIRHSDSGTTTWFMPFTSRTLSAARAMAAPFLRVSS